MAVGVLLAPLAISFQPTAGGTIKAPSYSGTIRDYLRVARGQNQEVTGLQTSIVRLAKGQGDDRVLVDLVSAVHMADPSYYATLNAQLAQYDAVLYELVAAEEAQLPPSPRAAASPDDPLALVLAFGKRLFGFQGQLDGIDYSPAHFVHADLSPEQMFRKIRDRGDNELSVGLSVAADFVRAANLEQQRLQAETSQLSSNEAGEEWDLLGWLTDPHTPVKLKRMLAEQFDTNDILSQIGPTLNTILISDRNTKAVDVLREEMADGKKRIAIFYGAAHMPDLEERITAEHGLNRTVCHWLTAWDLRVPGTDLQQTLTVSR